MNNQRVVVAGGSRGIGKAIAKSLALDGHRVVVIARNQTQLNDLRTELTRESVNLEIVAMDLTDRSAIRAFFESQSEPFDSMIVTAGIARHRELPDILDQDVDDTIEMNVVVPILCTRAFSRLAMLHQRKGSIVLFSSQLAHVGAAARSVYSASKAAIEGFTRGAVADLSRHHIRINTICPTFTETEMTREALSDQIFRQSVEANIPLGRLGQPEDCIGICRLLISDQAEMITGASIKVDGGWTAL